MRYGKCSTCRTPLLQGKGFCSSGLCGPCFTGEADSLRSITIHCPTCRIDAEVSFDKATPRCPGCKQLLPEAAP